MWKLQAPMIQKQYNQWKMITTQLRETLHQIRFNFNAGGTQPTVQCILYFVVDQKGTIIISDCTLLESENIIINCRKLVTCCPIRRVLFFALSDRRSNFCMDKTVCGYGSRILASYFASWFWSVIFFHIKVHLI